MAIDYGTDLAGVDDLDFGLTTVSGPRAVAQGVAIELKTPHGSLWYDREYGNDLRRFLNEGISNLGSIAHSVEATALRDQRVQDARARVTFIDEVLTINVRLTLASGPFDMTLTVDKLTVALLAA